MNKNILIGILCTIVLLIIITAFNSLTTVPTGYVGVKTRFGKVQDDVINEGLNFKAPFIEKIVKINCKTQKIEETSEGSSKDLQSVKVSIALNYNVEKKNANKLYQEIGTGYEDIIIKPAILESIKQSISQYNAEELITKRASVSNEIQDILSEKISNRGFEITEFNITNIDFSEEFDKAIETKAVKQQEVESAKAELEKSKINNQKKVEDAKADAEVMKQQNKEITENTLKLKKLEIEQELIKKWDGKFPTTMLNENISGLFNLNNKEEK